MIRLIFLIFVLNKAFVESFECKDLTTNSFAENENSFQSYELKEVLYCLSELGQVPVPLEQSQNIWNSVKNMYGGIDQVPKECFQHMYWSLNGIPAQDYANITIDEIDLIEAFGMYLGLSSEQMRAIVDRIRVDWAGKTPQHYSEYDLMALNELLCYFEYQEIEKIHPDAYKFAAEEIGKIRSCSRESLQSLAKLATQTNAFGSPNIWSKFDIETIGVVALGLSQQELALIPSEYQQLIKRNSNPPNTYDSARTHEKP